MGAAGRPCYSWAWKPFLRPCPSDLFLRTNSHFGRRVISLIIAALGDEWPSRRIPRPRRQQSAEHNPVVPHDRLNTAITAQQMITNSVVNRAATDNFVMANAYFSVLQ